MYCRILFSLSVTLLSLALAPPTPASTPRAGNEASSQTIPSNAGASAPTQGKIVKADDIILALKNLKQGQKLDYRGRTIEGNLDLFDLQETDVPSGKERVVMGSLDFRDAVFLGTITTWDQGAEFQGQPKVRFASTLNCTGAQFHGDVNFDGAVFDDHADFGSVLFHKMASFTEATFKEFAEFRSAQFDGRALFPLADFRVKADFAIATFNWIAFFPDSKFSKDGADFLYARFNNDAVFARAGFKGLARFVGTHFRGPASFSDATFEDQVWFAGGARFDDTVTFRRAKFTRIDPVTGTGRPRPPALFQGVTFSGEANFADSQFAQVEFGQLVGNQAEIGMDTVFRQRADFRGTRFGTLSLRRVSFQSDVDFSAADLGGLIDVTEMDIGRAAVHIKWAQLLNKDGKPKFQWQGLFEKATLLQGHEPDRRDLFAFLAALEKTFQRDDQLGDAGEVHYFAADLKRRERPFVSRVLDTVFLKGIYGYGVSPMHQFWLSLLFIAGFGLAYLKHDALHGGQLKSRPFRLRIAEIPVDWSGAGDALDASVRTSLGWRYWRGLSFSSCVFNKMGYGGVEASRSYAGVVMVEWVVGAVLWSLFLWNLSSELPILNRFVSSLL
jgi:uncharacterized protein YjbI with pentapeptide repeats